MEPDAGILLPAAWERLTVSAMEGVILVVGAPDTGKTTLARYLYRRLGAHHERLAFLDGDVGQATLGPPTTMTLALSKPNDARFPPDGPRFGAFVGDISPRGHMLPIIVGAHRLVRKAAEWRATAVVVDTTGLVDPNQGGGALKMALVDLLRPKSVIGLQRGDEIEHLLVPLRRSLRTRVIDLDVANAAQRRDATTRRRHRAERFRRAFRAAGRLRASWIGLAVIPAPSFTEHRLVALENDAGFALALGIVVGCECSRHEVELLTPLDSLHGVDAIRLGDLAVDPQTFQDRRL